MKSLYVSVSKCEKNGDFCLFMFIAVFIAVCCSAAAPAYGAYTQETCIDNTADEPACKDCCDCLDIDGDARAVCRDACAGHDFSANTDIITVDAPSTLGPDGDYSVCISGAESEAVCKDCCDDSVDLECGDRRYCRDACKEAYGDDVGGSHDPPEDPNGGGNDDGFTIEDSLSDEGQEKTIAFDGLAFLTGDLCMDTFFPPGKVSDFFGFQYLRDNDSDGMGHNTDFAYKIGLSILDILTGEQVDELVELAKSQVSLIDEYGYGRFVLIKAFRRLLEGELPAGATGLDKEAVMEYSAELYGIDADISFQRAKIIGGIIAELDSGQKDAINSLAATGFLSWPDPPEVVDPKILTPGEHVTLITFADQLHSWYVGSVAADTYFCPERHGTYFGSFYLKDIPAMMAEEAVSINENMTAEMGEDFLNLLTTEQAALVTDLVDIQKTTLNGIVATRQEISELLRKFMDGTSVDEDEVSVLVEEYGALDGEIVYNYAVHFSKVGNSLSSDQETALTALRTSYNDYECTGAYLYSENVTMPDIPDTDFLFGTAGSTDDTGDNNTDCPAEAALGKGSVGLNVLRAFRDRELNQTVAGKIYVRLYYHFADEVSSIISADADLRLECENVLRAVVPLTQAALTGNTIQIDPDLSKRIVSLLERMSDGASFGLKSALFKAKHDIRKGKLPF